MQSPFYIWRAFCNGPDIEISRAGAIAVLVLVNIIGGLIGGGIAALLLSMG